MMKGTKFRLTIDQPETYQIKVPGNLKTRWINLGDEITLSVENEDDLLITSLTGTFDQAALISLLRRLYSLGLPLISVRCLDV